MSIPIISPFPVFNNLDGTPLENGYIYIGVANLNPETSPVNVYWDPELTIPAAQPIRTIGGYPSQNGSPSNFYVSVPTFSITVRNVNKTFVYSSPTPGIIPFKGYPISGEDSSFVQDGTGAVTRTMQDKARDLISVKDFGAVGDGVTDDTSAIQAALAHAGTTKTVLIPNGNFVVTGNCVANSPVVFDGFLTITSATVKFELKSQPIVLTDYRKIYMGSNWNVSSADCSVALSRAVNELLTSFKYYTLDGEGWKAELQSEIQVIPPTTGFYGQFKTIQNLQIILKSGFGNRNSTSGIVTPNLNAFAFSVSGPQPASVYGIIFENIHIYCAKNGSGINFDFSSNQESEINNCRITNFYLKAIISSNPLRINGCYITGGDFNLYDEDRTITGIELLSGDSEIIATTISYCKYGIVIEGATLLVSSTHIFNGSTHNQSPAIYVKNDMADLFVNNCYLDNGPILIERQLDYTNFGRVHITNSCFTWAARSRGNRSFIIAKPVGLGIELRGMTVMGCQFRDYRIYQRYKAYTGDGSTTAFISPLVRESANYLETECSITSGSKQIKVDSTYKYQPGLKVTGQGIPSNTVISSIIDTQTLELNNNATETSTNASLTFSETLEVKVNGSLVFDWTLSAESGNVLSPVQTVTFSSPPANGATISLFAKYFAVVPFDVDYSSGSLNTNNSWDLNIINNSFYDNVIGVVNTEPTMRQSSSPILKITTNDTDTQYPIDWGWKTPFRLHVLHIESIGWRCATTAYVPPPVIGYDYINALRGALILATAEAGVAMIKGFSAGSNNINPVV